MSDNFSKDQGCDQLQYLTLQVARLKDKQNVQSRNKLSLASVPVISVTISWMATIFSSQVSIT